MAASDDGAAGAAWVRVDALNGPTPSARSGASAVVLGNHVYLLGGLAGGDVSPELWSADLQPRGERAAASARAPTPVRDCRAVHARRWRCLHAPPPLAPPPRLALALQT